MAAQGAQLQPCSIADLGVQRNAFASPMRRDLADGRLNLIVVAPTVGALPAGRSLEFYGNSALEWNPFFPLTRQSIAEYAVGVARLNSLEPTALSLDQGLTLVAGGGATAETTVLILDAWAAMDPRIAQQLATLDLVDLDLVPIMIPSSMDDPQTVDRAEELRTRLATVMPNHFGNDSMRSRRSLGQVGTLEAFRNIMPDILKEALRRNATSDEAQIRSPTLDGTQYGN
jgi:FxsC-like protein